MWGGSLKEILVWLAFRFGPVRAFVHPGLGYEQSVPVFLLTAIAEVMLSGLAFFGFALLMES